MAKILVFSRQCLFLLAFTSTIRIFITPFLIRHSHKVHLQTAGACRAGSRVSDSLHYHPMHVYLILSRHLLVSEGIYSSSNPWDEEKYKQECAGLMFSRIGLLAELEELGLDFNGEKDGYHDYDGENGSSRAGEDQQTLILPVGLKVETPARVTQHVHRNGSSGI
ncbi:hypothetical protein EDD21DRAFT_389854 [Dissophora ornata]|nr:hypothetical protein EDD21DRAFT_389854 [Dissophora ornata]